MKNEGMNLDSLLATTAEEAQEAAVEQPIVMGKRQAPVVAMAPLNADIPADLMRDLKMISVYSNRKIKEIVTEELTRYVKKAKKKMMEEMGQ